MRLPEIELDDRRFQDLVSEARTRISRACPEWTEHNVSDPGITLIELFAWMTEMTIYRLNRVPDKLHVALLDLLGIRLDGPSAATTSLRFRLADAPTEPILIPGGDTEVGTPRTAHDEAVIFQVDEDFTIPSARPEAYVLQRHGAQAKSVGTAEGEARPQGPDQLAFGTPPQVGDALYLGFEDPLDRLIIRIDVEASPARGAGVDPKDPPLRWEVSQGDNEWAPATVLDDSTGGFNYGDGQIELELPPRSAVAPLGGHRLHWLRCRIADTTMTGRETQIYAHAPEIASITAVPMGARLPATHAARIEREIIGVSDGTPGQILPLRHHPVLKLGTGETLEVQDPESGDWARWEPRDDFVGSTEFDRHFVVDLVSGEIEFGPAIRETSGRWAQYGAVPPKGAVLRVTHYRHGGGRDGNVTAESLTDPQEHDRRRGHGHEPGRGQRRRRRRDHHPRAPARGDGDPLALPRRHRRGLRVPGRRGEPARRARRLHPAARRRPGAAAPRAAHPPRRPAPALRRADAGRGACSRRSPSTSTTAA